MSAVSATAIASAPRAPGLARLTRVELRKMVDTRAGFWLLAAMVLLVLAVGIISALTGDGAREHDFDTLLGNVTQPVALLLPIVGILLVTSEWTQRTTLQTFALVPRRARVVAAKTLAAILVSIIAFAVCLVVAALGTAISGDGSFSMSGALVLQDLVFVVTTTITGVAFGAAFLRSAPAIVLSFVLPIGFAALMTISWLHGARDWLDTSVTTGNLYDHAFSATEWAQVGTSLALWMLLPLAIGTWRILRSEIS